MRYTAASDPGRDKICPSSPAVSTVPNNDQKSGPNIEMYTQAWCGYCAAARKLLKKKGVEFNEIDVTMDGKLRSEMNSRSGRTTVPQIFINGQHIGGYDDLAATDRAGKLDALLTALPPE